MLLKLYSLKVPTELKNNSKTYLKFHLHLVNFHKRNKVKSIKEWQFFPGKP